MGFEPIKGLVSASDLGKTGEDARRISSAIIIKKAAAAIDGLFGENRSADICPSAYKNGKLAVRCSHGVWSQEASLRRPEIIEAINRSLGEATVKDIIIK